MPASHLTTLEIPIQGMDCADCTRHVQHALANLPGVSHVEVFLSSEKALVELDPTMVELPMIRQAVEQAGYKVGEQSEWGGSVQQAENKVHFTRLILFALVVLFGVIVFAVVGGEWLGLFDQINAWLPWWVGLALVLLAGYPIFLNVIRAALQRQVIAHTLMTAGVIAALLVGEWVTALMVVFFMRVGDAVERISAGQARRAIKDLAAMVPQTARVEREGAEIEIPASQVQVGEVVVVRPGEKIPVDGEVFSGWATISQAAITGEAVPIEAVPGMQIYAATIAQLGSLRVQAKQVGMQTTFGQILHMIAEAERRKAPVERIADRFSAYYLPVVGSIAAITFLISRDPLATAAVLVVACACAFALATPVAMLASIGAGARNGLMIKGGKYLELLSKADVVLIDKTGTLTLGKPEIVDLQMTVSPQWLMGQLKMGKPAAELAESEMKDEILRLAASAERYSEHPLAQAVRAAALERGLIMEKPEHFEALPGIGVQALVNGLNIQVGSQRLQTTDPEATNKIPNNPSPNIDNLSTLKVPATGGRSLLYVHINGVPAGLLTAADRLRPEVPQALADLQKLGIRDIQLLTGDQQTVAEVLAHKLGIPFRANLLPQDKIEIVKAYQSQGKVVVMIGDGVNDAPALTQADVGIAMGTTGSDISIEAADVVLMRDDWLLVPELFRIARRTMRVVKGNIGFTAAYNLVGLTLAAFGILPPVLASVAQSLPDLGILANSARLIRQK